MCVEGKLMPANEIAVGSSKGSGSVTPDEMAEDRWVLDANEGV